MNIWASLSLLQPLALFAGLALPVLVLAYLRQKPSQSKRVPSLILLRELTKHRLLQRRFHPPLHFYLELLALLLLILAAAQPWLKEEGKRVAILVDTSLSMRAFTTPSASAALTTPSNRLVIAKKALATWIEQQASDNTYSLYGSAPNTARLSPNLISAAELLPLVNELKATTGADSLAGSVQQLGASGEFDRILLVTDRTIELQPKIRSEKLTTRIDNLPLGELAPENASNPYLSSISLTAGESSSNGTISAEVGIAGNRPLEVTAQLLAKAGGSDPKQEIVVAQKTLRVAPGQTNLLNFQLSPEFAKKRFFSINLSSPTAGNSNLLVEDDTAWVSREERARNRILIVTPEATNGESFGLQTLKGFEVTQVLPIEYTKLSKSSLREFALLIFRHCVPNQEPLIASLFILPPQDNALVPVSQLSARAAITSWAEAHPLTAYLKVPLLKPINALVLSPPRWAQSIINVEEGPILSAGENRGVRSAATGFELLPFEGAKSPAYSVLLLNLFRWLTSSNALDQQFLVGSSFALDSELSWVIVGPDQNVKTIQPGDTSASGKQLLFSDPGFYQLTSIGGKDASELQRDTQFIAVNTFLAEESQLLKSAALSLPATIEHSSEREQVAQTPLWPLFLGLALLTLILEYLVRTQRLRLRSGRLSTT